MASLLKTGLTVFCLFDGSYASILRNQVALSTFSLPYLPSHFLIDLGLFSFANTVLSVTSPDSIISSYSEYLSQYHLPSDALL